MAPHSIEELLTTTAKLANDPITIEQSIESIIRHELAGDRDDTDCMLARIGEFVIRATRALSNLTDRMVTGEHIDLNTEHRLAQMERADEFSDLDYLEYMRQKHAALRKMNVELREAALRIEVEWKATSNPPKLPLSPVQREPRESAVQPILPMPMSSPDRPWDSKRDFLPPLRSMTERHPPESLPGLDLLQLKYDLKYPRIPDESQGSINEMIASLSGRGKGHHTCPLGIGCRKNGVSANGAMIVFNRNSAFRAHLEKHGKRYKCEIPGCKNKDGFARKDQLLRHQQETSFHVNSLGIGE